MNMYHRVYCRAAHIAVEYKGYLIIWGGYMKEPNSRNILYHSPDELFMYCPQEGSWERVLTKGDIPPMNSGSCAIILDNYLYVFGGYYANRGNSNSLYRLNLITKVWNLVEAKGIKPTPCDKLCGWLYKRKLYFFGGFGPDHSTNCPFEFVVDSSTVFPFSEVRGWNNQLIMFDPETCKWSWPKTQGIPPSPRAAHAGDISGDNVFIFGGRHLNTRLNDLHCLNMKNMTWSGINQVEGIEGRSWHSFSFIDSHRAIIYGGLNTTNQILTNMSIIDTDSLSLLNSSESLPRLWHQATYLDETKELVITGGYIVSLFDNNYECWVIDIDDFNCYLLNLPYDHGEPRCAHTSTLINSELIIHSGVTQPFYINEVKLEDHAEEILILHIGPKSLLRLSIELVLEQGISNEKLSFLPKSLKEILVKRKNINDKSISVNIFKMYKF